jgi:TolB-like protein
VVPSRDEVARQLDRVLRSEALANAERARRFLRYVVERTLAGDGDRLKEFVIGVDVFDRDDQYDPRIDSIVRVEAGRLRSKLDQYYSRATDEDRVVIHIPRGSYVPSFEFRAPRAASAASQLPDANSPAWPFRGALIAGLALLALVAVLQWSSRSSPAPPVPDPEARGVLRAPPLPAPPHAEPIREAPGGESRAPSPQPPAASREPRTASRAPKVSVVVLPFEHFSSDPDGQLLAARFTDGVTSELARIEQLAVVSRTSALQLSSGGRPLRDIARELDAQVVVEGSLIAEGTRVHADVRLVDTVVDRKSWSRQFAADVSELRALQRRVAADVAAFIAPPRTLAGRPLRN